MAKSKTMVRKYGNRKLYDETRGRYLSMLELSDLVAGGETVEVVCDLTGSDLTLETLARALYERVKDRNRDVTEPFTTVVLSNLIAKVSRRRSE
jgi:polyhydroxyalkanoate synthesis regulator protein